MGPVEIHLRTPVEKIEIRNSGVEEVIAGEECLRQAPSPAPEPPNVNLATAANPDALARLTSAPTLMPVSSPRISQGVVEAQLVRRVEPLYPINARTQHLQGKVTLSATIAIDGTVPKVAVVGGSPVLAEAAKTAVLKWKYRPATLNGTPIEVQKEIIVIFAQP